MTDPETISLSADDLEHLYELARKLLQLTDYDEMLDTLVHESLSILKAERGFLVLQRGDGLDFKVVRNWKQVELEAGREPISQSIIARVLEDGEPLLIEDALADPRFGDTESVMRMGIRSVLAAPLAIGGKAVGALYIETHRPFDLFGPVHLELFERILALSSKALEAGLKRLVLEQRNSLLEKDLFARFDFPGIVAGSPQMLQLLEVVAQVAPSDLPVLVQGPSGTGKELIARALHVNSKRSRRPMVTVNCGAISPNLLESELFGHVRGAFTGATRDKTGLIPSADRGTVFLDEVGELPKELQVKLLRTLQFGEVQPVGSTRPLKVDVRFVAATNRDLEEEVAGGNFREDLLYRLNAITIELPCLKDRPGDILPLFFHFLRQVCAAADRPLPTITDELEQVLQDYAWPGNVRELENEVRRMSAIVPESEAWAARHLSRRVQGNGNRRPAGPLSLEDQEKQLIQEHLERHGGNRTHTAKSLGLSREGLRKKMKRYGIT